MLGLTMDCWHSIGQALIFTGEAVAVVLGGNIAYAFKVSQLLRHPLSLAFMHLL